jgi:pSer/pThr/pTyr-binding forkhead associated (FHA) protein
MAPGLIDRFRTDCALETLLEIQVVSPDQPAVSRRLHRPWAVIGRVPKAHISIDHEAISQRHAYLQMIQGRLFVVELETRHRLTIEGTSSRWGWVAPGQRIYTGPFQIELLNPPPPSTRWSVSDPLEDRFDEAPFPLVTFDISDGKKLIARWILNRMMTIVGRSARCRLCLPDGSVSRTHCSLVATPRGIWVVDLMSREGTRVNGEPIELALLRHGDRLDIGIFRLRIQYPEASGQTVALAGDRSRVTRLMPDPILAVQTSTILPSSATVLSAPSNGASNAPLVVSQQESGALMPISTPTSLVPQDNQLLLPLVQQFSSLQREMFDQFQKTMVMMVQMFSTMHQEQVALLREELAHFQKATEDLRAAQQELRERKGGDQTSTPSAPTAPTMPPSRWAAGGWPLGDLTPPPPPTDTPQPVIQPAPSVDAPPPGEDVHEWLSQRIANLENERQSRWERILSFIRRS